MIFKIYKMILNRIELDGSFTEIYSKEIPVLTAGDVPLPEGWKWALIQGNNGRPCCVTVKSV